METVCHSETAEKAMNMVMNIKGEFLEKIPPSLKNMSKCVSLANSWP
jgi:hypothetical protein